MYLAIYLQALYDLILGRSWIILSILSIVYWLIFPSAIVLFVLSNSGEVTPIPEGELRRNIDALADKIRFPKESILVMHSAQAKSQSNAFHISFFGYTRLIIFESLIQLHKCKMSDSISEEIS